MKKFKNAFNGLKYAYHDKSVALQFLLSLGTITVSYLLKMHTYDFIVVLLCCINVICLEMINTCIEKICNMISVEYSKDIQIIKDISAGFVLSMCLISLVIGIVLIAQYI